MNPSIKIILLCCFVLLFQSANSQSIGVRAGVNYSKFMGPLESGESFAYTSGIHFGISYGYKFTPKFMLRTELVYSQAGNKQHFHNDNSYFLLYVNNLTKYELGARTSDIEVSNAYISLPIVASYMLTRKFEVFGGLGPSFLVNPIGRGKMRFESTSHPEDITFIQSQDHKYYGDAAGQATNIGRPIKVKVDGVIYDLPKVAGAYYFNDQKEASLYRWFNLNTTVGANYFLNKGFFLGGRWNFGLIDVTNEKMDISLYQLNTDNSFIKRNDKDYQSSFELSLGFRF